MWTFLTLPYLRGGQVVTPGQRWGRISSAQMRNPDVTVRSQWSAVKPKSAVKPNKSPATWDWWRVVWLVLSCGLLLVSSSPSDSKSSGSSVHKPHHHDKVADTVGNCMNFEMHFFQGNRWIDCHFDMKITVLIASYFLTFYVFNILLFLPGGCFRCTLWRTYIAVRTTTTAWWLLMLLLLLLMANWKRMLREDENLSPVLCTRVELRGKPIPTECIIWSK